MSATIMKELERITGEALRASGLSKRDLARRAGLRPETLSRIARRGTCDFATVSALARAAGLRLAVQPLLGSAHEAEAASRANAVAEQAAIYHAMSPTQRLEQGVRMNRQMRSLMEAGFRAKHPDWTPEECRRAVAQRILHARTG